jgi:predicted alpha/beta-hydrolase family hydrolase
MNQPFMSFFHRGIAEAGYACLKFNFLYSEMRRRSPDPQPVLLECFRKAMAALPGGPLALGGKSMGGRMASYLAGEARVAGLFFLGYPLHPPGKPDQLRDQHLYNIRKPILFAGGTKDPFARFDLLERTLERIGKYATTYFVDGGGHSFELPKKSGRTEGEVLDGVLQALLAWLESV